MLSKSKISHYKIKKTLKYFVQDCSSTEVSKIVRLNRKTIDRYYNIFRDIMQHLFIKLLYDLPLSSNCLGCVEGEYAEKNFFNIHKFNQKVFLIRSLTEETTKLENIVKDDDFNKFARFVYLRFTKFHGLTQQNHYLQICESIVRYNYTQQELFNYTWKKLSKKIINNPSI